MPHTLLDAATPADSRETERFIALVADKLTATDRLFRECLASDVPFIQKSGEYIFDGGGKRMRPALLLLCARLLDRDGEEEVTYAAVVELIHTATLIHDDIIDHSALRRGRQTINELWGNNLTVLLGDWLYTTAMKMALRHGSVAILDRLCEGRGREDDLANLEELADRVSRTSLCGLGQTAPNPVLTSLRYFREEFEAHVRDGRCPAGRCAALIDYRVNASCIGCTLCAQACPVGAIAYRPHERHAVDLAACTRCNMCFEACQDGAVEVVSAGTVCAVSPRAVERTA